jgi:serine/threonine protein kinase
VYRTRLRTNSRTFALKVVYNHDPSLTYKGVIREAQLEINMFKRLPPHPNIVRIEHHFSDRIPTNPAPPNWDADSSIVAPHALFIVMELCKLSLQDVISYRRSLPTTVSGASLFTPEEVLMVARNISCALVLLNKELVAHRDIKPDNILIRLPSNGKVTRQQVMDNINQPGVILALTDFGMSSSYLPHSRARFG